MKKKIRLSFCLAAVCLLALAACASTTLHYVWKDDSYNDHIKKVFVIGVAEKPGVRRIFEREFVSHFKARDVEAVPSYEYMPPENILNKDAILSIVKDLNVDSVLITTLVGTKTVERYDEDLYGYYYRSYNRYSRGYTRSVKDEIVNLETRLYDIRTEKLIWTALSETVIMEEESTYRRIKPLIEVIMKNLAKEELF